jgi:hypothetical protein
MSNVSRIPVVCLTPTGNLWLLIDASHTSCTSSWVNLETGEVRYHMRPLTGLISWGWSLIEGDLNDEITDAFVLGG